MANGAVGLVGLAAGNEHSQPKAREWSAIRDTYDLRDIGRKGDFLMSIKDGQIVDEHTFDWGIL